MQLDQPAFSESDFCTGPGDGKQSHVTRLIRLSAYVVFSQNRFGVRSPGRLCFASDIGGVLDSLGRRRRVIPFYFSA